jgi:hypothetical protein
MKGDLGLGSMLMLFVIVAVFAMGWFVGARIGKQIAGAA